MAVYSRTQATNQSNNTTTTAPQLPSVDLGTIIVKSFETASEAMGDDKALPVKIIDKNNEKKENTQNKQLEDLLKKRTPDVDETKLNALLKTKKPSTTPSSQITKTLNNLNSLLLKQGGNDSKQKNSNNKESLIDTIKSGHKRMQDYQEKNNKELKSLKDMTLLSVIGKMVPTAVKTGVVLAGLPYAVKTITKFMLDFPVNASKFSTWLRMALTGPDSIFVKFGRTIKSLINSMAVGMADSENPVISALGAGIAKATGSNVSKKVVISQDVLNEDDTGEIQKGLDYLNSITGGKIKANENGDYAFDINQIREDYLKQQTDAKLDAIRKKNGGYRDYLSAGETGTSILAEKLKASNANASEQQINDMLISIDAGMYDLMDDINAAKAGASNTKGLKASLMSKLASRAKAEGKDSSAGYLLQSFGGDASKAAEAVLSYLGANEGNKLAKAQYDAALKEFTDATNGMALFQRNFAEKADYSAEKAKAKQKEEEAYLQEYQNEVQKHALAGDWSEMQWMEYLGDGESKGSQQRQVAFQNYARSGSTLTVKDKGPIENLHDKASERVEQNKQAGGNVFNSVFGITPTQCVSSFNNLFN